MLRRNSKSFDAASIASGALDILQMAGLDIIGGTVGGAVAGATIGSVGGPVGTAGGLLAGGAAGAVGGVESTVSEWVDMFSDISNGDNMFANNLTEE
jgi:hypothetical protein